MKSHRLFLTIFVVAVLSILTTPSFSVPVMDIRIEDLVRQTNEIKASLNMTPNQIMLWQQVQTKVSRILQARRSRREQLQADIKLGLGDTKTELRDLAKKLDAEEDLSNRENKQLRELWLTMNDALDDSQQQMVLDLLIDQLQRSAYEKPESTRQKGDGRGHGMGRQRSGGMNGGIP